MSLLMWYSIMPCWTVSGIFVSLQEILSSSFCLFCLECWSFLLLFLTINLWSFPSLLHTATESWSPHDSATYHCHHHHHDHHQTYSFKNTHSPTHWNRLESIHDSIVSNVTISIYHLTICHLRQYIFPYYSQNTVYVQEIFYRRCNTI